MPGKGLGRDRFLRREQKPKYPSRSQRTGVRRMTLEEVIQAEEDARREVTILESMLKRKKKEEKTGRKLAVDLPSVERIEKDLEETRDRLRRLEKAHRGKSRSLTLGWLPLSRQDDTHAGQRFSSFEDAIIEKLSQQERWREMRKIYRETKLEKEFRISIKGEDLKLLLKARGEDKTYEISELLTILDVQGEFKLPGSIALKWALEEGFTKGFIKEMKEARARERVAKRLGIPEDAIEDL